MGYVPFEITGKSALFRDIPPDFPLNRGKFMDVRKLCAMICITAQSFSKTQEFVSQQSHGQIIIKLGNVVKYSLFRNK